MKELTSTEAKLISGAGKAQAVREVADDVIRAWDAYNIGDAIGQALSSALSHAPAPNSGYDGIHGWQAQVTANANAN